SSPDICCFFFSSRRRHTSFSRDWSSDVCSSDLMPIGNHTKPVVVRAGGVTERQTAVPQFSSCAWRNALDMHAKISDGHPGLLERSEEHTSELQSRENLVCRLLLEKKNEEIYRIT